MLGINTPVTLVDFVERFVPHNTIIILEDINRTEYVNRSDSHKVLWRGMDWQITDGKDYFDFHPEVKPCPYRDNNVMTVHSSSFTDSTDEICIRIEA